MAKARLLKTPQGGAIDIGGGKTYRFLSGSMGATGNMLTVDQTLEPDAPAETGHDAGHDRWAAEIAQREAAEGISGAAAPVPLRFSDEDMQAALSQAASNGLPHGPPTLDYLLRRPEPQRETEPAPDLTALPDRFVLEIERKPDAWVVRARGVHIGLFVADPDLREALAKSPKVLAEIVKLDGMVPAAGRGKPPR